MMSPSQSRRMMMLKKVRTSGGGGTWQLNWVYQVEAQLPPISMFSLYHLWYRSLLDVISWLLSRATETNFLYIHKLYLFFSCLLVGPVLNLLRGSRHRRRQERRQGSRWWQGQRGSVASLTGDDGDQPLMLRHCALHVCDVRVRGLSRGRSGCSVSLTTTWPCTDSKP